MQAGSSLTTAALIVSAHYRHGFASSMDRMAGLSGGGGGRRAGGGSSFEDIRRGWVEMRLSVWCRLLRELRLVPALASQARVCP